MSLPSFSVRRPVTIVMAILIMVLMGGVSLFQLPVELYPNTGSGEISILIYVRGQIPPSEVEQQVTKVVEDAVAGASYLNQVLSISKEGESTVVLSFEPGTNMDFAALEVREKFSRIKNELPKEIEKPIIAQFKQTDTAVLVLSATSHMRTPEEVRRIIDESVKERFKRIDGVANVEIYGGRERKILVEIDQQKRVAYGVTMDQITGSLSSNNLNLLSGEVERTDDKLLVRLIGEFDNMDQIKNLGIARLEFGSVLRLEDIATVKDGYLDPKGYARFNTRDVVSIYIQKETTENTINVVKGLLTEADVVRDQILPEDIKLVATSNQATFIEKAIDNLKGSLLQGSILIFLVFIIFLFNLRWPFLILALSAIVATILSKEWALYALFLGVFVLVLSRQTFRSVIIVTLSIPISVVSTFLFMKFSGNTLNVMTLFGLALGVGMLVDNSIVVFDNILKKKENGFDSTKAAVDGSQELLLAIVASTLTTVIVFLPLIFMSKEIQLLYKSMALTVVVSLILSLLCALTIVPLVSSRKFFDLSLLRVTKDSVHHWLRKIYPKQRKILFKTIRYSPLVLMSALVFFLVSLFAMSRMPMEYLGSTEQNKFTIFIEMPSGTKLEVSNEAVKKVEKLVETIPEVDNVTSRVEAWSSKVYVELVPATDRKRSISAVIDSLRPHTDRMQPAFIYYEEDQQVGTKELTVEVFGYNYTVLRQLAIGIANRLEAVQGLTDMKIRMREGRPEMRVHVDKPRASTMNVSTQSVADQVHAAMRGLRATLYHEKGREVETITRLQEKYRKTFRDLYKLGLSDYDGEPLLLEQVANFRFDLGPSEIWRKNKDRMIQVSANLNKIALSEAVSAVHEQLKDLEFPEEYYYRIGGDYSKLIKMQREMKLVIIMVITLVYLVLASLFESFTQPILIMIAVPLALGGALFALWLGPKTIGIGALLGMMMLAGISVNHSIMLVDRINYYRQVKVFSPLVSVLAATKDRMRPILLTTCTTVLGLLPMAIDQSEGANLWSPLACTVIGGLISSMFLTLMILPTFYLTFEAVMAKIRSAAGWILNTRRKFQLPKVTHQ